MQAILILAHKDIEQLRKLISYFRGRCVVFVHIDKKAPFSDDDITSVAQMEGVAGVYKKYSVHWGGFSILQCEMFLLREAIQKSGATYFHLISGQDYPMRPLDDFIDCFEHTSSDGFLCCQQIPFRRFDDGTFYRMQYFVPTDYIDAKEDAGKGKVQRFIDWQTKIGIKRRIPDQFERLYGGSAWFSISRKSATYLTQYTSSRPSFYRRLRMTYFPEEVYVATVLMNSRLAGNIDRHTHYRCMLWRNPGFDYSPFDLTIDHFEKMLKMGKRYFARKVCRPSCNSLLATIDKYMLSVPDKQASATGCWQCQSLIPYDYDNGLSDGIIYLCKSTGAQTACDFGCGVGFYVSDMQQAGIAAIGYDGNPFTKELSAMVLPKETKVFCEQLDLTEHFAVDNPYPITLLLNVGEYIPHQYTSQVLDDITACTSKYIVVAWDETSDNDDRIVNPMSHKQLSDEMRIRHFAIDRLATNVVSIHCNTNKYKRTINVFTRK